MTLRDEWNELDVMGRIEKDVPSIYPERPVYVALTAIARESGAATPEGFQVTFSIRAVARAANVSRSTAVRAIEALRKADYFRRGEGDRVGPDVRTLVLVDPALAENPEIDDALDELEAAGHLKVLDRRDGIFDILIKSPEGDEEENTA
jgi:DNA-binding transcriptional MocR family regulator